MVNPKKKLNNFVKLNREAYLILREKREKLIQSKNESFSFSDTIIHLLK